MSTAIGRAGRWASALAAAALTAAAQGATYTWTGGGGDDLWSTGANWGGTAPLSSSSNQIIFTGTTRLTPALDTDALQLNSLTFDSSAGAFVLGRTHALGGQIAYTTLKTAKPSGGSNPLIARSSSSDVTINNPITVSSTITTVQVDSGTLIVPHLLGSGSGGGSQAVKTGGGQQCLRRLHAGRRRDAPRQRHAQRRRQPYGRQRWYARRRWNHPDCRRWRQRTAGTQAGSVTVAGGGTIAPGTSAGTLMIGRNSVANTSLLIGDGGATVATLAIEIDSSGADKLVFIQAASPTGSITSTT